MVYKVYSYTLSPSLFIHSCDPIMHSYIIYLLDIHSVPETELLPLYLTNRKYNSISVNLCLIP